MTLLTIPSVNNPSNRPKFPPSMKCVLLSLAPFLLILQDQTMQMCESLPPSYKCICTQTPFVKGIRVDRCEERCRGLLPRCIIAAVWLGGTQSLAFFWGCNGPLKSSKCLPGERTPFLASIVCPYTPSTPLIFEKVSPFSCPSWLEAIVVHTDLVPADDSLTQHRNVKTGLSECVCVRWDGAWESSVVMSACQDASSTVCLSWLLNGAVAVDV